MLAPTVAHDPFTKNVFLSRAIEEVDQWVWEAYEGTVASGPFEGMKLLSKMAWRDGRLSPMVLGSHEEDLHGEIERQINRLAKLPNPIVSVIGAAEGYYAIGFKRRLPHATVLAIEPNQDCVAACREASALNGVQVVIGAPSEVLIDKADLLFLDCEGHEVAYLDPAEFPSLAGKHIIVEIHNYAGQETDKILLERFRGTHRMVMVFEGPRNPSKYQKLTGLPSEYRYLAVSEGRPCLMSWFIMEPKGLAFS